MNYYFDPKNSPLVTLVSGGHNTRPCPFSGHYSLTGRSLASLLSGQLNCARADMHAGCSSSDNLIGKLTLTICPKPQFFHIVCSVSVESACSPNLEENVKTHWSCHGRWSQQLTSADNQNIHHNNQLVPSSGQKLPRTLSLNGKRSRQLTSAYTQSMPATPTVRQIMLMSTPILAGTSRHYVCLSYIERDGVMSASASLENCDSLLTTSVDSVMFNITSSGPCLQALTGSANVNLAQCHWLVVSVSVILMALSSRLFADK